ncbi:hypothetical protein K431DRAFT_338941 [Polychaeton citri CBS 116435]|uniref:Steroid 5-alpha reductase C-terminal domain-containing protein n=1 Tax=Polychaeton citri CBS 116435 TaxID=1314669 RepID=A0A9P4QA92_9PEZI|nr:hypothetical protein K431DRAFT_338941 [Polychaeton citri CBS 116435]
MTSPLKAKSDNIDRGNKQTNYAGTATFFGLRLLDPIIQHGILAQGAGDSLVATLGGRPLPRGPSLVTNTFFDRLGLSPYRSILFAMSVGGVFKQNLHLTTIMQESMSVKFGAMVGFFNITFDSINSLIFIAAQTSASTNGEHFPQTPLIAGSALYLIGMILELGSEYQRHVWKKDPANKGQVYDKGLFGLSRHINYFGYTLWRTGYALAAGGWVYGAAVAALFSFQFTQSSIPQLAEYLQNRYGEKYKKYERDVPYSYIPFVW